MRIGICDDNSDYRERVVSWLKRNYPNLTQVYQFSSGEAVLDYIEKNHLDMLFIDIRMNGIDGIETSRRIRLKDMLMVIVALTDFEEYAPYGYDFDIYRYILKTEFEERIGPIFTKVYDKFLDSPSNIISIRTINGMVRLSVPKILYIESNLRKKTVYTMDNNEHKFYRTMEEIIESIKPHNFVQINKSYIINSSYVKEFSRERVIMNTGAAGGVELFISRSFAKDAYNELMAYLS